LIAEHRSPHACDGVARSGGSGFVAQPPANKPNNPNAIHRHNRDRSSMSV
jgi:hypothetical protein